MNDNFFSKIAHRKVAACYFDWSLIAAEFDAPVSPVLNILPSDKLQPIQIRTGVTSIKLIGIEYRQIDKLAPYNEFMIAIPAEQIDHDGRQEIPIYYIFQLPVTTQEACDAGVKYYGYPKFVAQIDYQEDGETTRCRVKAEGKDIVSLEVQSLSTTHQSLDFCTYSVKNEKLLKTLIQIEGQAGLATDSKGAKYFLGDHPVSIEIMNLKMSATPTRYQYAPRLQSILHRARDIVAL